MCPNLSLEKSWSWYTEEYLSLLAVIISSGVLFATRKRQSYDMLITDFSFLGVPGTLLSVMY